MPPPDYASVRKVVPPGGISTALTPDERADPYVQRYIAEQRAAAEPWSAYIPRVATNMYNAATNLLTEGIAPSAIAQGVADTAVRTKRLLSGETPVWDPLDPSRPNPEAVETAFDAAGTVTVGSAAVPAEVNALRAGAKGQKSKIPKLTDNIEIKHVPLDQAVKENAAFASMFRRGVSGGEDFGNGDKIVTMYRVRPDKVSGATGNWRTIDGKVSKAEVAADLQAQWDWYFVEQLNDPNDPDFAESLKQDDIYKLFGTPNAPATPFGQRETLDLRNADPEDVEDFVTGKKMRGSGGTTLNSGLGGFLQRGLAAFAPEKGGGSPANPPRQGPMLYPVPRPDGYYSKAEKVLLEWPQQTGTAEQFKEFLKKNGVKKTEIDAMGLDKLTGKVDKMQLVTELARNEPRIKVQTTPYFESDTMPGGTNYRMLNIRWDNPDALHILHPYRYEPHRLPKNTLVHARLKDDVYTGADGEAKKVLRVEELQSDWAQQGKNQWALPAKADRIKMETYPLEQFEEAFLKKKAGRIKENPADEPKYRELAQMLIKEARSRNHSTATMYRVDGVDGDWETLGTGPQFTPEELLKEAQDTFGQRLQDEGTAALPMDQLEQMLWNEQYGRDVAPYVSQGSGGVIPLAMKEVLKQAAAAGQDEIVIAPGKVHSNRWARSDSKRAKGLETFYDEILPKEINSLLKDVSKESGVKGLKVEVEERPFVDYGGTKFTAADQDPVNWFRGQNLEDHMLYTPEEQDAVGTSFTRVANSVQQNIGTSDEVFTELANEYRTELDTFETLMRQNNELIEQMDRAPMPTGMREVEEFMAKYEAAQDRNTQWSRKIRQINLRIGTMPTVRDMFRYWEQNVKRQASAEGQRAMVIKLTPELREYINKNGLPRFAKGGIVDLAEISARAI